MSKSNQNFLNVDIFSVSRHLMTLEGDIEIAKMDELKKFLADDEGVLHVVVEGIKGAKGLPGAVLTVTGTVHVPCTRCTKAMEVEVEREVPFLFVKSEAEANRMPLDEDDDYEITVGSDKMNVIDWVQEEVILSLPNFPKHDDCESVLEDFEQEDDMIEVARPNPFANLKDLLKK